MITLYRGYSLICFCKGQIIKYIEKSNLFELLVNNYKFNLMD